MGLLVALPSLRFGGLTLALATLALAFVGDRLVFQLDGVRNGSRGWSIPRPEYGPIDLGDDKVLYVVLLVLVVVVVGVVGNMRSSATGRSVRRLSVFPLCSRPKRRPAAIASSLDLLARRVTAPASPGASGAGYPAGRRPPRRPRYESIAF